MSARRHLRNKNGHAVKDISPEPSGEVSSSILDRIMSYAVPLVGVIGAALYGVLRLAYLFFYLRLRASPDEVGYGYSQVLADELIGAIELVLLVTLFLMLPEAIIVLFSMLFSHTKKKLLITQKIKTANWIAKVKKLALWCLAIAIPLVLIGLPVIGWIEGEEAANGYTVRNVYLSHFITLPVLAVEAVPANVAWVASNGSAQDKIAARQCLLYLGQSDGIAVFYDVHSQESIRLPVADIIIMLQDTISVPIGCLWIAGFSWWPPA